MFYQASFPTMAWFQPWWTLVQKPSLAQQMPKNCFLTVETASLGSSPPILMPRWFHRGTVSGSWPKFYQQRFWAVSTVWHNQPSVWVSNWKVSYDVAYFLAIHSEICAFQPHHLPFLFTSLAQAQFSLCIYHPFFTWKKKIEAEHKMCIRHRYSWMNNYKVNARKKHNTSHKKEKL